MGFYSEQTGESVHHKFELVSNKNKMKSTNDDQYGEKLRKAVVEFSSTRL